LQALLDRSHGQQRAVEKIAPAAAERLIRVVYSDEDVSDIHTGTKDSLSAILVQASVLDLQLDDAGLDEFLRASTISTGTGNTVPP
jgi:hypothetical protein